MKKQLRPREREMVRRIRREERACDDRLELMLLSLREDDPAESQPFAAGAKR